MKVMASGLKAGKKVIQAQSSASSLSKAVTLGGHYRLFFPLCRAEDGSIDLVAAVVPGRDLDYDALHMAFVPIDEVEVNEVGKVKDVSCLVEWKKIINVIHDADYAYEVEKAKKEARDLAERTGTEIDSLALNQKLRTLELEFYGDREAKPSPVYATRKPVMSGFKFIAATEAFLVPLKESGEPRWGAGQRVSVPMSSKKRNQLEALLEKPEYYDPDMGMFLEVGYDYVGESKQAAGQAATFQGISKDLSLRTKYPELWKVNAASCLSILAKDGEGVAAGNMSMSSSVKPDDVVAALKKYISRKKLQMTYIDYESDNLRAAASALLNNAVCADMPAVESKLRDIVKEEIAKSAGAEVSEHENTDDMDLTKEEFEGVKSAQTLKELSGAVKDPSSLGEEDGLDLL